MTELPRGWAATEFKQIADIKLGKMLDKAKNRGEPTRYLRNVNVRWGRFDLDDISHMPMSSDERAALRIGDGDILICEGGEPGRSAVWDGGPTDLTFQKALMRMRPRGGIEPRLLTAFLRWSYDGGVLERHFTGTTIKHLPQAALSRLSLALPPLPEQQRIAAKIESLTGKSRRARDHLDHIPRLVEKYKRAVLAAAFRGELTRDWRKAHDLPGLRGVRLGDVAEGFNYGSAAKSAKEGAVPVLRMGNIQDGKLDWADLVFTDDAAEIGKYRLVPGDVLFNRTNSPALVGKTALYDGDREAIYAGYLIKIRCKQELLPAFLTYCLNSPMGRAYSWTVKSDGVSQSNINAKKLAAFSFDLPSLREQAEIVRRIETAFIWIDRLASEATSARRLIDRLDQSVLTKAFRGELVPQDPDDEPASVLLDRIRAERGAAPKAKRGRKAKASA